MPAKTTLKAAEKQTILKKLVTEMKRRYGGALPKQHRSAFETLLFAACLEDTNQREADEALARLLESFFDLNEIRVSSVSEIEAALGDLRDAEWKALRIRESLQYVFEKHYAFDLESLRRKTHEVAAKELSQIPHQTSFLRNYVIQQVLGGHVLPLDQTMKNLLAWLGLADPSATEEQIGEDLKSAVKKSEGVLLCHLLKCTATDPDLIDTLAHPPTGKNAPNPFEGPQRLVELFKRPRKKGKKTAAAKAVSHKKPAKKSSTRPVAASKAAARKTGKKVTKKRPAPKKTTRNRAR